MYLSADDFLSINASAGGAVDGAVDAVIGGQLTRANYW